MAGVQSGNVKMLVQCVRNFTRCGYSTYQVISQLADVLLENDSLEANHKTKVFEKLGVRFLFYELKLRFDLFLFKYIKYLLDFK